MNGGNDIDEARATTPPEGEAAGDAAPARDLAHVVVEGRPEPDATGASAALFAGVFGTYIAPLETTFLADDVPEARVEFLRSDGVVMADIDAGRFRSASRREYADRTQSGLIVSVARAGQVDVAQDGRRGAQPEGTLALVHTQVPFEVESADFSRSRLLVVPDRLLAPLVGDTAALGGERLSLGVAEFDIAARYLASLAPASLATRGGMLQLATRQIADLLAAGLARTRRREDPTEGRGVRGARFEEIKRRIDAGLASPLLNAERVGRQMGVSARYVQMLMDENGTTFSAYVTERRLEKALALLLDPALAGTTVGRIGELAGFPDPAHFSRVFRRRFGETPGGVRRLRTGD